MAFLTTATKLIVCVCIFVILVPLPAAGGQSDDRLKESFCGIPCETGTRRCDTDVEGKREVVSLRLSSPSHKCSVERVREDLDVRRADVLKASTPKKPDNPHCWLQESSHGWLNGNTQSRRYAILAGVEHYEGYEGAGLSDAVYSPQGVAAIGDLLVNEYGFEPTNIWSSSDTTINDVQAALQVLSNPTQTEPLGSGDLLVFYFTGHGKYNHEGSGQMYLATAYTPETDPLVNSYDVLFVDEDDVPWSQWNGVMLNLRTSLDACGTVGTRQVVILDACETGGAISEGLARSDTGILRTVLTAVDSQHDTPAGPFLGGYDGELGPLFTRFLVDSSDGCPVSHGLSCLFPFARESYVQHIAEHCNTWPEYGDTACVGFSQYATGIDLYENGSPANGSPVSGTICSLNVIHDMPPNISVDSWVDFYVDGEERFQDTSMPFAFSWNIAGEAAGPHEIRAEVHHPTFGDSSGMIASRTITMIVEDEELARVVLSHRPASPEVHQAVTVSASIRDVLGDPEAAGENVEFWTDPPFAGSWLPSSTTVTNDSGVASVTWIPDEPGTATLYGRHVEQGQVSSPHTVEVFELAGSSPQLTNPDVSPLSGTTATLFAFSVDYLDADGDVPLPGRAEVYIDGHGYDMSLASGTEADGTYVYTTELAVGWHYYSFRFTNANGMATTPARSGPFVAASGNAIIEPLIDSDRYGCDIWLKWSLNGTAGPWTPIGMHEYRAEPFEVPIGSEVTFRAGVDSPNFYFREYEVYDGSTLVGDGTGNTWTVQLDSTTTQLSVRAYYRHSPQSYSISGTVRDDHGGVISAGVDVTLSSPLQTMTQISTNGSFSFSGVSGGVDIEIVAEVPGYAFRPARLIYACLDENHSDGSLIGSSADVYAPITTLVSHPPLLSDTSSVSFAWMGEDDISVPGALQYQYMVEGHDSGWSAWTASCSVSYDLPNGVFAFLVRAKDQVGNINQAPLRYAFAVSGAPSVASAVRTNHSVWSSRLLLSTPASATTPSNMVVIIPRHSGAVDDDLVPISVHIPDDPNPIGVNEIVAALLGLPTAIEKLEVGWALSLPESLLAGDVAEYDVVWGRIAYLGWGEEIVAPAAFPDGGDVKDALLGDDGSLWRVTTREDDHGTSDRCDDDAWLSVDRWDGVSLAGENVVLRFTRGECWGGSYGTFSHFRSPFPTLAALDDEIGVFAGEYRYSWDGTEEHARRAIYHIFRPGGSQLYAGEGSFIVGGSAPGLPKTSIGGMLWTLTTERLDAGSSSRRCIGSFVASDHRGLQVVHPTVFDEFLNRYTYMYPVGAYPVGSNVLLIWQREWETEEGYRRSELDYSVVTIAGQVVVGRTRLTPALLGDAVEEDDDTYFESAVFDRQGQVWISYHRQQSSQDEWYYSIIKTNGTQRVGPVLASARRLFIYCDSEGYVWAIEGGQVHVLNPDNTDAVPPRSMPFVPSQDYQSGAAYVRSDGAAYRPYDRWSPVQITVEVPEGVHPTQLTAISLDVWDASMDPVDTAIDIDGNPAWELGGGFTGMTSINVEDLLEPGLHGVTVTQTDFHGGQVLLTFPYESPVFLDHIQILGPITVDEDSTQDFECEAHFSDGSILLVDPAWTEDSVFATIDAGGLLTTLEVPSDQLCGITAEYVVGGVARQAGLTVTIVNAAIDCNGNGIPDECDLVCGEAGAPCDVPGCGESRDCNTNGIPDECEDDADGDGVPDDCDECPGHDDTLDRDSDSVPDGCDNCPDAFNPEQEDADEDGVGDACEYPVSELMWVHIEDPGVLGHEGFLGSMSKHETTNAQYCRFLNAALASGDVLVDGNFVRGAAGMNPGGDFVGEPYYRLDGPGFSIEGATNGGAARITWTDGAFGVDTFFADHPVTHVSWYGATAFADYYGWRLPTEWEWQAVADSDEGSFVYGCGLTLTSTTANYRESYHPDGTTPVGDFGEYGAYAMCDMAGNAWEWTSSPYGGVHRMIRGGRWNGGGDDCKVNNRDTHYYPETAEYNVGFRVAKDPEDCNENGFWDYQDFAACDGSPWCRDCNGNGVLDECDLTDGTLTDSDGNGIPDECVGSGDMNCDSVIDMADVPLFVESLLDPAAFDAAHPGCGSVQGDLDGSGLVNGDDVQAFVEALLQGP